MNPEKLTAELRRIASVIMASNAPSLAAVRRDLEGLVRRVADDEVSKRRAWHFICENCRKDKDHVETDMVVWSVAKPTSVSCPLCKMTTKGGEVINQSGITKLFNAQKAGNLPENED